MQTPQELLYTSELYRQWLLSLPLETYAGTACSDSCPLARFISDITGEHWFVDGFTYYNSNNKGDLPQWAIDHAHQVDYDGHRSITRGEALLLLNTYGGV